MLLGQWVVARAGSCVVVGFTRKQQVESTVMQAQEIHNLGRLHVSATQNKGAELNGSWAWQHSGWFSFMLPGSTGMAVVAHKACHLLMKILPQALLYQSKRGVIVPS